MGSGSNEHWLNRLFISAWLGTILLIMNGAADAAVYSFSMDRFSVTGNLPGNVTDDFDDGNLSPNWEVWEQTVVESGTTVTFTNPATPFGTFQLGSLTLSTEGSYMASSSPGPLSMQNGAGDFTGESLWNTAVPAPNQFFRMDVISPLTDEKFSIKVHNVGFELATEVGISAGTYVTFGGGSIDTPSNDEFFAITPGDVTGDILLQLAFNDVSDTFSASFSLDGGSNFLSPFSDVTMNAGAGELRWVFGAESYTVVPVPAAAWLFGSGLISLIGLARRKAHTQH